MAVTSSPHMEKMGDPSRKIAPGSVSSPTLGEARAQTCFSY
jgi:hypothetical protein